MRYIYARVSTDKQETDGQLFGLREKYPDASLVEEVASGGKHREALVRLVAGLQGGDTLIVAALDRLGRKTTEILGLIEDLEKRGVTLISVREGVDYNTITGRLVTQILVSIAEMERRLISERTKVALAAKKAKGIVGGRRPSILPETVNKIKELRGSGMTVRAVALVTGVSASRISELTRAVA